MTDTTGLLPKKWQIAPTHPNWGAYEYTEDDILYIVLPYNGLIIPLVMQSGNGVIFGRRPFAPQHPSGANHADLLADTISVISKEERDFLNTLSKSAGQNHPPADNVAMIDLGQHGGFNMGISRKHALLERHNRILYLTDLHSSNGTYLNGMALIPFQKRVLRNSDVIRLGMMDIVIHISQSGS